MLNAAGNAMEHEKPNTTKNFFKSPLKVFDVGVEFFPACMAIQQAGKIQLVYYLLPLCFDEEKSTYMVLPPMPNMERAALYSAVDLPAACFNHTVSAQVRTEEIQRFLEGPYGPRQQFTTLLQFSSSYSLHTKWLPSNKEENADFESLKFATALPVIGNVVDLMAVYGDLLVGRNFAKWNGTVTPTLSLEYLAAGKHFIVFYLCLMFFLFV